MTDKNADFATSTNISQENKKKLMQLFPEAFSDGQLDFDALTRSIGGPLIDGSDERYGLSWAGRSAAYKVLQTPTSATVKPQRHLSINFDEAEHVFIEGENLEVLKVLQKAYFGKVKLIYIDPPYNTGSDAFVYPDRFQESKEAYLRRINELADDGSLMREGFFRKNSRDSGHFHSNWLSMMLPRLYIARNILHVDGVILVSIDDNEAANLKLLMDEVFGPENFIAQLVWEKGRKNDARLFSVGHEYMLVYARSLASLKDKKTVWREPKPGAKEIIEKWSELNSELKDDYAAIQKALREWYSELPASDPSRKLNRYKWVDKWGPWRDRDISWPGGGGPTYDVIHPETKQPCKVPERGWGFATPEEMERQIRLGLVKFRDDHTEPPFRKAHLIPVPEELDNEENEEFDEDNEDGENADPVALQVMRSYLYKQAQVSVKYLRKLLGGKFFNNPKDHEMLARLFRYCLGTEKNALVLDFFGGSASTFEAVATLNERDGSNHSAIVVQLPEALSEKTAAYKAGFRTIPEISRKRISQVISRIEKDSQNTPRSLGFKSFQLAPSNFKQWRGDGIETAEQLAEQIGLFIKIEKDGALVENMLFELILKFGQRLTEPIERIEISGSDIFAIKDRNMLFVLDGFTEEMVEPLLALKPREIITLESVFDDSDQLKTNLDLHCRDAGVKLTCI
jgi:adenine-specific DNA-methyltransferase